MTLYWVGDESNMPDMRSNESNSEQNAAGLGAPEQQPAKSLGVGTALAAPSEQPIWEHPAIKEAQKVLAATPSDREERNAPTPRTDLHSGRAGLAPEDQIVVDAHLSRQLERELAAAVNRAWHLEAELNSARALSAVSARSTSEAENLLGEAVMLMLQSGDTDCREFAQRIPVEFRTRDGAPRALI